MLHLYLLVLMPSSNLTFSGGNTKDANHTELFSADLFSFVEAQQKLHNLSKIKAPKSIILFNIGGEKAYIILSFISH